MPSTSPGWQRAAPPAAKAAAVTQRPADAQRRWHGRWTFPLWPPGPMPAPMRSPPRSRARSTARRHQRQRGRQPDERSPQHYLGALRQRLAGHRHRRQRHGGASAPPLPSALASTSPAQSTPTGNGQTLSGAIGNASEGLSLDVGGTLGARGNVTFARVTPISSASIWATRWAYPRLPEGAHRRAAWASPSALELQTRLARLKTLPRAVGRQFDTMIVGMNSTSTFLTQQLSSTSSNN